MAVVIRLARGGAKKRPFYRIVAADKRMPRDGRFIEKLGTYNPMLPKDHENRVVLDEERARYWIDQGALPSDRVHRMLSAKGILPDFTWRETPSKSEPGTKAKERAEERAAKAAELAAAAAEAEGGDAGGAAEA